MLKDLSRVITQNTVLPKIANYIIMFKNDKIVIPLLNWIELSLSAHWKIDFF